MVEQGVIRRAAEAGGDGVAEEEGEDLVVGGVVFILVESCGANKVLGYWGKEGRRDFGRRSRKRSLHFGDER